MKRFLFLTALTSFLLTACEINPHADFSVSSSLVEPGEDVYFTNLSSDADSYLWDFGDGLSSYEVNPIHYYDREGTYIATLTASHRRGGSDVAKVSIEVYYTRLEVTVAEWNINNVPSNLIPNAEVTLYVTYDDWFNFRNPVETRTTNSYGLAVFPSLQPTVYFIDIQHPYFSNEQLAGEDVAFIETLPLVKSQNNTFIAWVDRIVAKAEGNNRFETQYKIKSEKRTFKSSNALK
jgi:hypothetical protein